MANKERGMAVRQVDSQLIVTLYEGERQPEVQVIKSGRMTGQMIMGAEGSGIMLIDRALRRAQMDMRQRDGLVEAKNERSIEDRLTQTKENSGV